MEHSEQKDYRAVVTAVAPGSIAAELGIMPGDVVAQIDGTDICDYFDYQYLASGTRIEMTVIRPDGDAYLFEIENEAQEDLGLSFDGMLFGGAKSCANRCVFCFIDQLPRGMRKTLYFKDDDTRLSFLYGNYVTLTNMSEAEFSKIIRYRISPVNISLHTVDPQLRIAMLRNKRAGEVMGLIRRLHDAGIAMNMQVVLCPHLNDGEKLDETISAMAALAPGVESISVVPVGLTRYREGLYPMEAFDGARARAVIRQVEAHQERLLAQIGTRLVYLSDEFYILAGEPIPPYETYEAFPQIENGVGMIASMQQEFTEALQDAVCHSTAHRSIATGEFSYDFIRGLVNTLQMRYNTAIDVFPIHNAFFGGGVTVSGLLCGCDLIAQLSGKDLGETLYITKSMLRAEGDVFLDDVTVAEVERALGVRVVPVANDGYDFVQKLLQ